MPLQQLKDKSLYYTRWTPETNSPKLSILFIHGLGSSHAFYAPIAAQLATEEDYDVVAYDTYGQFRAEHSTMQCVLDKLTPVPFRERPFKVSRGGTECIHDGPRCERPFRESFYSSGEDACHWPFPRWTGRMRSGGHGESTRHCGNWTRVPKPSYPASNA